MPRHRGCTRWTPDSTAWQLPPTAAPEASQGTPPIGRFTVEGGGGGAHSPQPRAVPGCPFAAPQRWNVRSGQQRNVRSGERGTDIPLSPTTPHPPPPAPFTPIPVGRHPPPPRVTFRRVVAPLRGPWTVTRSSLRMLRRVAAFCRPLRRVLPLVSFPRSRSPVVGVPPPPPRSPSAALPPPKAHTDVHPEGPTGVLTLGTAHNRGRDPPPHSPKGPSLEKKRSIRSGKSGEAIFGAQVFGSQTPPPQALFKGINTKVGGGGLGGSHKGAAYSNLIFPPPNFG